MNLFEYDCFKVKFGHNPSRRDIAVAMNQFSLTGGWEIFRHEKCKIERNTIYIWVKRTLSQDEDGNVEPNPGEAFRIAMEMTNKPKSNLVIPIQGIKG